MEQLFAGRRAFHRVLGVLMGIGMLWCFLLAFWPVSGFADEGSRCGAPALHVMAEDVDQFSTVDNDCALAMDLRIHRAVGYGTVVGPMAVLWLWLGSRLRADILQAEQDAERVRERAFEERRRNAAGGRGPSSDGAGVPAARKLSLSELAAEADSVPKVDDV